ncbi:MAG: cobyrinate a,c-diamide synthase [Alphaproteobacteria bacterium]
MPAEGPAAGGPRGLLIAAPASGSGKTTIVLGLLRCLRGYGVAAAGAKVGPDYIDPAFHTAASGRPCPNLDAWAMRPATLARRIASLSDAGLVIGEGVMGLFDGGPGGAGSTAELAARTGWPVVMVVNAKGMAASAAALLHGFRSFDPRVSVAGAIFNRVGSPRHAALLRDACAGIGLPVLGAIPSDPALALPDRHLGLIPAGEHPSLETFLDGAASRVGAHIDLAALTALARPARIEAEGDAPCLPPPGQRIAVARDAAFAFAYPALLDDWQAAGAEVLPFSPLADMTPDEAADAIYLPGGYPELHAGRLAANSTFLTGLRNAAARGVAIYGECGGYMALGQGLIDAEGHRHAMAGLLSVETSFAARRLHLGYRRARLVADGALGPAGTEFRGHEFHFATIAAAPQHPPLFEAADGAGAPLGPVGERAGSVAGSFLHLIDRT